MSDLISMNVTRTCLMGIAVPLTALLGACAGSAVKHDSAKSMAEQTRLERQDVEFALDKGVSSVIVDNPYGDVHVSGHAQDEVGVHAVIQRLPPEFAKIELVSFREGRALHLKVKSPPGKSGSRYDMAVYVPAEMALVVHGTSHRIVARKRVAPLTITTTSGPIEATSQGRLDLSTDSGAIRASQLVERWSGSSQIQSKSGRIIVLVPLSGDVSIRAQTGGKLSTDFGLSIHPRDGGGSVAAARYGTGASELRIDSVSGEVIIDQSVILMEDDKSVDDDD